MTIVPRAVRGNPVLQSLARYAARRGVAWARQRAAKYASEFANRRSRPSGSLTKYRTRHFRRRRYRRRTGKRTIRRVAKISRAIRTLQRRTNNLHSVHHNYELTPGTISCTNSAVTFSDLNANTASLINNHLTVPMFNPSAPGTLINADLASPTYQQSVRISNCNFTFSAKNNHQIPCILSVYVCVPRTDTSVSPATAIDNAAADQNLDVTGLVCYPTMSDHFNKLWRIAKKSQKVMEPGGTMDVSWNSGGFNYDPSEFDEELTTYQVTWKPCVFLLRLQGVIGHAAATGSTIGTIGTTVDYAFQRKYSIEYNSGGVRIERFTTTDSLATTIATPVVSQYVADNQGPSTA